MDICQRCKKEKVICFRVRSDILDDYVCAACADKALEVNLQVEKIVPMIDDDLRILNNNAHISDHQIWQDIHDTQDEITIRLRLNYDADGITERQEFIAKLQRLLALRREKE